MHCIDMNAWYSRIDKPDRPDFVLFDLDPPEGDGFALAVRVAHLIRAALEELDLRLVREDERRRRDPRARSDRPTLTASTRRTSSPSCSRAGSRPSIPGEVTTEWLKKKRTGVLVDHRQNGWGKTIASVYSVRPKPGAPVSTPLAWDELTETFRPRDFTMAVALERVERLGDLFEPVLGGGQRSVAAAGPRVAERYVWPANTDQGSADGIQRRLRG